MIEWNPIEHALILIVSRAHVERSGIELLTLSLDGAWWRCRHARTRRFTISASMVSAISMACMTLSQSHALAASRGTTEGVNGTTFVLSFFSSSVVRSHRSQRSNAFRLSASYE